MGEGIRKAGEACAAPEAGARVSRVGARRGARGGRRERAERATALASCSVLRMRSVQCRPVGLQPVSLLA
jgi:hypothetical protein